MIVGLGFHFGPADRLDVEVRGGWRQWSYLGPCSSTLPSVLLAVIVSFSPWLVTEFRSSGKRQGYSVTGSVIGLIKSQNRFAVVQRAQGLPPSHLNYNTLNKHRLGHSNRVAWKNKRTLDLLHAEHAFCKFVRSGLWEQL
jgi:hypothetical protein